MLDVIVFVLARLVTRKFWYLVVATFFGVLAMWVRSTIRNEMFQEAAARVGKRF